VIVMAVAACSPQNSAATTTTTTPASATSTTPSTTIPLVAGCPEDGEFTEGGDVSTIEQTASDADTIGLITWAVEDACETFTVSFETSEGAPATTPPTVSAAYIEDVPVIRLTLDADQTVITDQLVETPMVDRLYVVTALDGGMFIDIHLASPAQARIAVESSPAQLVLDLQPGIVDYPTPIAISEHTVVVTPLDGSTGTLRVPVSGYARTFESTVLLIATAGGEVVEEEFATAADSLETWGEFSAELTLRPGEISLFVGDENQEDGGLEGVTISLTVQ